jgi:predicted O-methyltransferase YrrM
MTADRYRAVDDYIEQQFVRPDEILQNVLIASAAAGLPAISVTPAQGKFLGMLASLLGAKNILEIGTLGGYSTIWLARGMAMGGRLITLEADAHHVEVARKNIAAAGLAGVVEVLPGPAADSLPQLAADSRGPFDLIFIDADKPSTPEYFQHALALSRPGSLIVVDNVVREGKILDAESDDPSVQGVRRFYELAAAESRVSATVIQTMDSKGHDGFALLRVV